MSTPNLALAHIAASQNSKEVTANSAFDGLDTALCQPISIVLADHDFYAAGGGSPAVTNMAFIFTGTLSDNRTVFLPNNPKPYIVNNNTTGGKNLVFKIPDGSPAVFGRTVTLSAGSGYQLLYSDGANVDQIAVATATITSAIQFVIDGGGSVPATGAWGQISIPYACTIKGWTISGDASGSAVIDVLRSTYSGFPTTSSIAGSDKPTLTSAQKNTDATLTGWGSTALLAGDELQINLNSVSTCKRLNLTLKISVP